MNSTNPPTPMPRCPWAKTALGLQYHDREWGVPQHDDRVLFEFLVLEGAQAGLSWSTILEKRGNYRRAFDRFDPKKLARYGERKKGTLLADAGIVRNRAKIDAAIRNARAFLDVQREFKSFDRYAWEFVGGRQKRNRIRSMRDVPADGAHLGEIVAKGNGNAVTRAKIVAELHKISYKGMTKTVKFQSDGNIAGSAIFVNQVKSGVIVQLGLE
jgi:DNA-3-methyladenine glycosylase I